MLVNSFKKKEEQEKCSTLPMQIARLQNEGDQRKIFERILKFYF
jgi:hypothetical protein